MSASVELPNLTFVRQSNPVLVAAAAVSLVVHGLWLLGGNTIVDAVSLSGQAKSAVVVSLTHLTLVSQPESKPFSDSRMSEPMIEQSLTDTPDAVPEPKTVLTDKPVEAIDRLINESLGAPTTAQSLKSTQPMERAQSSELSSSEKLQERMDEFPEILASSSLQSETALKDELSRIRKNPRFSRTPTPPQYPSLAIKRRWQGEVIVHALIDERGNVDDLLVKHSSGFPVLDRSAIEAVSGWHFEPTVVGGQRIPSWIEVPVEFSLRR